MIMMGGTVTDKKAAGEAILALCRSMTKPDPIPIGEYRGFDMELYFESFTKEYRITLKHDLRHSVTLGSDIFGNIQRLDHVLDAFPEKLAACEEQLKTKIARLNELNAMLNLDHKDNEIVDGERAEEAAEPPKERNDRDSR